MFGISPEEAMRNSSIIIDHIYPYDRERFLDSLKKATDEATHWHEEFRITTVEGRVKWVEAQAHARRLADGSILWDGVTIDISQRKQQEEQLRDYQLRLEKAHEIAGIGSWEYDYSTNHVEWSQGVRAIYGVDQSYPAGPAELLAITHPDDRPALENAIQGAIQDKRSYDVEYRVLHANGAIRHVHSRAEVVRDSYGNVQRLIGIAQDVTLQRTAQAGLEESERFLTTVFENLPAMIFVKGAGDLKFVHVNRKSEEVMGYSREQLIGKTNQDLFSGEEADSFDATDRQVVQSGELLDIPEESLETPHLGRRLLHTKKIPILDKAGNPEFILGIAEDITERKTSEALTSRLGRILEASANELYVFDAQSLRFLLVNRGARDNLGYSIEELRALTPLDIKPHYDSERFEKLIAPLRSEETREIFFNTSHERKDGSLYPVEIKLQFFANEQPPVYLAVVQDATERHRTEAEMRLAASVFSNTTEGIMITEANGTILRVNQAFTAITGFSEEEAVGRTPAILQSHRHDESFYRNMWISLSAHGFWRGEIWNRRKDGGVHPVWQNISAVYNEQGSVEQYISVFSDISEKKISEERIRHLAHFDVLTELPNRLLFMERFEHTLKRAKRDKSRVALLFLDLDRFKHINDSLGHPIGDSVLQIVARRLRDCLREEDTVARLGGDEFTVILEQIKSPRDAGIVATKLIETFSDPIVVDAHELHITTSIGISIFPQDGEEMTTMIRNADAAMYRAKELGRSHYNFYTSDLTRSAHERVQMEAQLRRALDNNELYLCYQPQYILATGQLMGIEALLRWNHPAMGMVSPLRFIPVAEDSGLIVPIGAWVLNEACRQLKEWHDAEIAQCSVSVNLSGQQLQRGNLAATVTEVLADTGLPARFLDLEITETYVMSEGIDTIKVIRALRELGVSISIDDFGTGYSSLAYLKQLPIDRLKIDQSFVRDIPNDTNDEAIARAVIALGRSMKLKVLAEGVETEAQREFLANEGCDEVQGFLFSRPLPADEMAVLLRSLRP